MRSNRCNVKSPKACPSTSPNCTTKSPPSSGKFSKTIAATHQRIMDLASAISKTTPAIIAKPVNFILTNIVAKTLNIIQNIPTAIANFAQNITQN